MLKKTLYLLSLTMALCLIFWQTIFSFIFTHYLNVYLKKNWDAEFIAKSISKENGIWVIENPKVISISDQIPIFQAEKLFINDHWEPSRLDLEISAPNADIFFPSIDFAKESSRSETTSLFNLSLPSIPLIALSGKIDIPNGKLRFKKDHDNKENFLFSLQSSWSDALMDGKVTLQGNASDEEGNKTTLVFNKKENLKTLQIECLQTCIPTLSHFLWSLHFSRIP